MVFPFLEGILHTAAITIDYFGAYERLVIAVATREPQRLLATHGGTPVTI